MKIALIAPTNIPARRANTIQVMKMAQAMTALGHKIMVLVPGKGTPTPTWAELANHYGLQHHFEIEWLSAHPQLRRYDYGFSSVRRARQWGADLIYTRLPQAAAVASFLSIPTINEIHDLPQGILAPWLLTRFLRGRGALALVAITASLVEALSQILTTKTQRHEGTQSFSSLQIIVAPDGVDLSRYKNLLTPPESRQSLPSSFVLHPSSFVVGYTGHLYPGRGAELILDIAAQLPGVSFLLVGGDPTDVERLRAKAQANGLANVILTGFVPNAELSRYQAACDVLLMPYQRHVAASSGGDIAPYLSPMKLFEYLACGRAILSSDLPVLREVLNEQNAVLLPPEDVNAWVAAIQELLTNPKKRAALAAQSRADAQQYSWEARVKKILSLLP